MAAGVAVQFASNTGGAGTPYGTSTDINGNYAFTLVPAGTYTVTAQQHTLTTNSYGTAAGNIASDGATAVTNIVLSSTLVPSQILFIDANSMPYGVIQNGGIFNGLLGVFAGDSQTNQGGSLLSFVKNGTTTAFAGEDLAPTDLNGRQISLTQNGIDGLNVTRRVYVPVDGYFARYIELLSNPGTTPVTVGVQLTSNFANVLEYNVINNVFAVLRSPPQIIQTSSGDQTLNVNDPSTPDHWITIGGNRDLDPFIPAASSEFQGIPTVADVFDGPGGTLTPSAAAYTTDSSGAFSSLTESYNSVTVPAGGTVGILHYLSQENLYESGNAAATRLVQLPPEALTGISSSDLATIANFAVPSNGTSTLAALPSITNQIGGTVYAYDNITPVPGASVHIQSTDPIYARTYIAGANASGVFNLQGALGGNAIPAENFSVTAWEPNNITPYSTICREEGTFLGPGCAILSPTVTGSFTNGASTANQTVAFTNTGIITGTVSRGPTCLTRLAKSRSAAAPC